ncbi:hypothetical protein [Sphingobacterium lactis]|nr:hypothetical protein [Sphingobacterium lactis]
MRYIFCAYGMFLAQVRHRTAHYKRLEPAGEFTRLGEVLGGNGRAERAHSLPKPLPYFNRTTLAQELCVWLSVIFFMPTACFLAQVRHRAAHTRRRCASGRIHNLPLFSSTTLAQELCGRLVQWISCAQKDEFSPALFPFKKQKKGCSNFEQPFCI